jgi:hypothetical protein
MVGDNIYFIIGTALVMAGFLWVYFYYARNLLMHIFGRSKKSREWKYVNPFWKIMEGKKK